MATIKGLPRFTLSDAAQFNLFVNALSNAIGITDDAQVYIRPPEVRFGAANRRIYKDPGDNSMRLQDPVAGDKKLSSLAGASLPPVPPFAGNSYGTELYMNLTANRVYLEPVILFVQATITGVRLWVQVAGGNNVIVGLYNSIGTRLAQSASTALGGTAWQNISFSASYVAAPGLYWRAFVCNGGATIGVSPAAPVIGRFVSGSFSLPDPLNIPATPVEPADHQFPGSVAIISGGIF